MLCDSVHNDNNNNNVVTNFFSFFFFKTLAGVEVVVFAFASDLQSVATSMAAKLRQAGKKVDLLLENKKPKWVFKHADRIGAQIVVIVGPDEVKEGKVVAKDLRTSEQVTLTFDELPQWVASRQ